MQGFSGKILPTGLEIFPENRRLDLAFPSNPRVTFAPRTEMTAWCGPLKGAKMEVNGSRGRLDRKLQKRNPWKKEVPQKKDIAGSVKPSKPPCKEVWFYLSGRTCRGGQIKSFFPVCLLWVTACSIYGQAVIHGFPLPDQKNSEKEKSSEKP